LFWSVFCLKSSLINSNLNFTKYYKT